MTFAEEFRAAVDQTAGVPFPEGTCGGRGVVIPAGGWGMLPGVYVTASFLRWVGCKLPIEVWYIGDNGEFDPSFPYFTRALGVVWRDASAEARLRLPSRRERLHGWAVKPLLPYLTGFEQFIMLDADCYPVYDPERLWTHPEIASTAAAFWPDNAENVHGRRLSGDQWALFGLRVPNHANYGFEAGQMVIDKRRSWHAVQVAAFLSDRFKHFDVSRGKIGGFWGDKETFNVAWTATKTPYHMAHPLRLHPVAFIQHDPTGHPVFVHRHNDKPRVDFQDLRAVKFAHTQFRAADLPHEHMFHRFLRDLREMMRPQVPGYRDGTQDEQIWREIAVLNTYGLPPDMTGMRVLDVGGHIGLFSTACLRRGAEYVTCVEPYDANLLLTRQNLAPWTKNCRLVERAVAAADDLTVYVRPTTGVRTGETHLSAIDGEHAVDTISLDTLIDEMGGHVHLLKLDCEGSEYPALLACTSLDRVDRIVLEWHTIVDPMFEADPDQLERKLIAAGFDVRWEGRENVTGLMHATRRDRPHGYVEPITVADPVPVTRDDTGWRDTQDLYPRDSPWLLEHGDLPTWTGTLDAIPKKLHQFWTGPKPPPDAFVRWGKRWQELHPTWEYKFWTEAEVAALSPEVASALKGTPPGVGNPAGKSDVARCAIVAEFGGVWIDTDFEPVKPIDAVVAGLDAFMADNWGNTNMAVFGASARHPWMLSALRAIVTSAYRYPPPTVMMTAIHLGEALGVKILPKELFYPYPAQTPECIYKPASTWPDAVAIHRHTMSWIPGHSMLPMYYRYRDRF